jgi:hypothetical protein
VLYMVEARLRQFGTVEKETSKEHGKKQLSSGMYSVWQWHIVLYYDVYGGGLPLPATGSSPLSAPLCSTKRSFCSSPGLGIACISTPVSSARGLGLTLSYATRSLADNCTGCRGFALSCGILRPTLSAVLRCSGRLFRSAILMRPTGRIWLPSNCPRTGHLVVLYCLGGRVIITRLFGVLVLQHWYRATGGQQIKRRKKQQLDMLP